MSQSSNSATRAEVCAVACAEVFRDNGEILASAFGTIPSIGLRLARHTFSPDLMLTDGESSFVKGTWPVGSPADGVVEAWSPFRNVFDVVWSGKRHIIMIPVQIDRFGNVNISALGDHEKPSVQLVGVRGAPGNTVYHPTSYWAASHSPRTFVPKVDMVAGAGTDSAAKAGTGASRHHDLRKVVTNLAVLDFAPDSGAMRLVSVHPGVSIDDVREATGFELEVDGDVPETRLPTDEELALIRDVIDPRGLRNKEVPNE
ncbi:CoA-transferase [Nocardioides sp. JQ2195]|uniref:CoA-transferase subunit beta n=1 Tax=Nocardioides sp. JQ2195 TaxID=2592334 RepID=UPI00143E4068|nr:CoA-transferase [Nocardioides sp. JQ2195]QIX26547.1 CoA-transferase [Nocardioides sp. JQ2195]